MNDNAHAMLSLWQWISPSLPVGSFMYSQGLESAVENHWVTDEMSAGQWISGVAEHGVSRLDLPVLARLYQAWQDNHMLMIDQWNQFLLAARETAELLTEDQQVGKAMARLLSDLGMEQARPWRSKPTSYATLFALACCQRQVSQSLCLQGYLWAWCENQMMAAIKLVPLGQTSGQRILQSLTASIPDWVTVALHLEDDDIGTILPGQVMASMQHETQYSRLFRS